MNTFALEEFTKTVTLRNSYIPALYILYYLHLHRLNLSSFSSPIHHITTCFVELLFGLFEACSNLPVYGTSIMDTC